MKYKTLCQRHPDYNAKLWRKARAIHSGGHELLEPKNPKDDAFLREIFPPHLNEHEQIYKERRKRVFYIPYAGEIINSIMSGIFCERLEFTAEDLPDEDYYHEFLEDCSPVGGDEKSFEDFLKAQCLTALLCRYAWTLIDFPSADETELPQWRDEEEAMGLDRAYLCALSPESVVDWACDSKSGEFKWVCVHNVECDRETPDDTRDTVRETFTIYYADRWERYAVEYDIEKPPQENDEIQLEAEGAHTFGRVPIVRLDITEELWVSNKIMSLAIAHLNLRNALSWAEYKSLFPVPVAYLEAQNALNPATENPDRAYTQKYGQGYMPTMAAGDRIEYSGPDSSPYAIAMQDLSTLRDEMHRVTHQMAMSVDNSGAALQRSGDSKALDYRLTALLLAAYAKTVKEHAMRVLKMVELGRGDESKDWKPVGLDSYEDMSLTGLMEQATIIDTISIPSATFKREWTFMVASRALGSAVSKDTLEEIKKELEQNISNEDYILSPQQGLEGETDETTEGSVEETGAPGFGNQDPSKAGAR